MEPLPRVLNMLQYFVKWKAFDVLKEIKHILWAAARLEGSDVTNITIVAPYMG